MTHRCSFPQRDAYESGTIWESTGVLAPAACQEQRIKEVKVAFGIKAHSGWAALVVAGEQDTDLVVVDRRRVELVEQGWAKQPYHAAAALKPDVAREVIDRGIAAAHRIAIREVGDAVKRERERENEVTTCAVLVGSPMPDWSLEEILAAHLRLHQAEGVLFREALAHAVTACGMRLVAIPERLLTNRAEDALGAPATALVRKITALGRFVGPPWGKDQKDAALAALVALRESAKEAASPSGAR